MFMFRKRRSGNRATFVSIVIILLMLYGFKMTLPRQNIEYPPAVHFEGSRYEYAETVTKLPLQFTRKRQTCEEGFIVLVRWKDNKEAVLPELYLYQGFFRYRQYVLQKQSLFDGYKFAIDIGPHNINN